MRFDPGFAPGLNFTSTETDSPGPKASLGTLATVQPQEVFALTMRTGHRQLERVINLLKEGKNLALISDAGTPLVSDPGYLLVREAIDQEIPVQTLPGPTALVPALINSGIPTDKFVFEGFLPHKKGRRSRMEALVSEERTIIFYESPHRLLKTLNQLAEHLGELSQAAVSREISKVYEETIRGSLKFLIGYYSEKKVKGEIVIVVAGKSERT